MADQKGASRTLNTAKVLQVLVGLLFVCMGVIGLSSGDGLVSRLSSELSRKFGNDRDLLMLVISTVELVSGLFLVVSPFVKAIPSKISTWAIAVVWFLWLAIVVTLDVLTVQFSSLSGIDWLVWLEELTLHVIVLFVIFQARGKKIGL